MEVDSYACKYNYAYSNKRMLYSICKCHPLLHICTQTRDVKLGKLQKEEILGQ